MLSYIILGKPCQPSIAINKYMPRLSLYSDTKKNDFKYIDRIAYEQYVVGGTDLYIHKYLGPKSAPNSEDATRPSFDSVDVTNIQDLMFLENRDRKYDTSIYRLRGHYNVQNLDFDLSQFGLFLNNDIIFITVHFQNMIDIIGRKLMVGDVLELPHLLDHYPLDESIPFALKRYYQVTDGNYASEGFSQTWYPHLWRIKCEPLINSQEFADILNRPGNEDNFLGEWNGTTVYPPGYVINFGGNLFESLVEVPAGIEPPNEEFWKPLPGETLGSIFSTCRRNIEINDAQLREADRLVPKAGYDASKLYIVPTFGEFIRNDTFFGRRLQPAPPINLITSRGFGEVVSLSGAVFFMKSKEYNTPSAGIRISAEVVEQLNLLCEENNIQEKLKQFVHATLSIEEEAPEITDTGSGPVDSYKYLSVKSMGEITGPFGTSDNTFATSDQDPTLSSFVGEMNNDMNFKADCDPRFQFISRSTPRSFGYAAGYQTGDGTAPNGLPVQAGISFPANPEIGDYFLRIDYMPQLLYRWDGKLWIRISENVRTGTGFTSEDKSLKSTFINNENQIFSNNEGKEIPERQALSQILKPPKIDD
jgi:hypothetical protein